MTIVFIPALIALLEAKENDSGRELTREDVESIRDNAIAIELTAEIAGDMIKSRGYPDIDAENVWNEWLLYKKTKS
jgi:accessory colonization factor AcfC